MADSPLVVVGREAGIPLSRAGGLPHKIGPVDGITRPRLEAARTPQQLADDVARFQNLSPSLASILRPQAAYRWILPYLASITPTYIESVLRGALAGNHVQAWELFDLMIDTDPEIASCIQEYIEGVLSHKVIIEPYHEENEEPTPSAIEKCKLVSAALRGMRPDAASDENALNGTMFDLLFARFHGQSVVEVDWHDTYGSGKLNLRKVPGMKGQFVFPRSTFWVHPVCYAWSMAGRLGLRNALFNWRSDSDQYRNPRKQLKLGDDISSYTEPPLWNMITSQPRPDTLVDFPRNKFLISVFKAKAGTALGGSCLRPLAWWWVASNFCGDWLLNYAQLFGIPFRKATYKPGTSVDQQAEIRQMLQSCGSAGYILLPDTAELEFMDGGKGGAQSPQAFLFHFADSQKRKVILHQTMTGGQHDSMGKGGGKAFGDVENETKEQCIGAGARFASAQINLQLVPMILDLNYDTDADLEAPQVKLVDNEVGGLPDAQRDQVLAQIMPLPVSWLRSKYGVPKPGPDDEVAGIDAGIQGANAQQQQDNIDADRKQADVHAKMQVKQQADAAKAHADAVAKQPKAVPGQAVAPAPGQTPKQPGQQEKQPGADDNAEMDARNAELEAKDAASGGKGCLMAPLPADEIERFVSWAKDNVPEDAVTGDGIETEPHVTVFYGFNLGFDTDKLAELLKRRKPVTFTVGKLSRFKCPDYDVLKFDIESPDLENLHKLIAGKFKDDVTPSEHAYHPHLTASYIKKGSLTELDGEDPFEGEQFTVSSLLFSEPEHTNRRTVELKAIAMSIHPDDREVAATALHESVEPILDRIAAIEKIGHKATRVKMMRKLLKDVPHLAAAMMHDDSLAKAVAPAFVRKFAEGLAKGKKPK